MQLNEWLFNPDDGHRYVKHHHVVKFSILVSKLQRVPDDDGVCSMHAMPEGHRRCHRESTPCICTSLNEWSVHMP